jgi:hypothetical protein|tara:strand:- start:1432 stop:1542 length:111 start_codon:yes stop_codon:yes gene_type:complete
MKDFFAQFGWYIEKYGVQATLVGMSIVLLITYFSNC